MAFYAGRTSSLEVGRDEDGSLVIRVDGVVIKDDLAAVERYGDLASAIGWPLIDALEASPEAPPAGGFG